jgi:hypothetical protein
MDRLTGAPTPLSKREETMSNASKVQIRFNYDDGEASGLTVPSLLEWISELHSELTNAGLLPGVGDLDLISDETHQQIVILSTIAEVNS